MRPIKFRTWNTSAKIMLHSDSVVVVIGPAGWEKTDQGGMVLMQFTGLNDKNGKGIYEGDIFRYTSHPGYILVTFIGVVDFDERRACFGYRSMDSKIPWTAFDRSDELDVDMLPHMEVIGNIYENPELVKP